MLESSNARSIASLYLLEDEFILTQIHLIAEVLPPAPNDVAQFRYILLRPGPAEPPVLSQDYFSSKIVPPGLLARRTTLKKPLRCRLLYAAHDATTQKALCATASIQHIYKPDTNQAQAV